MLQRMSLLGPALASNKHTNALDHLGRRAASFGEKDIGAAGAVERSDRAGNNHGWQGGMKLFGAADEFVAVHLRHQQIA